MSEKLLWKTVKDGMDHTGHWDRIESHATAQGRPDVSYCIRDGGHMGDIELKVYDARKGGFVLRASQNAWHQNRARCGGRAFILARYDDPFGKKIYLLIEGRNSRALIHDRSYAAWAIQAKHKWTDRINWAELTAALSATETKMESLN